MRHLPSGRPIDTCCGTGCALRKGCKLFKKYSDGAPRKTLIGSCIGSEKIDGRPWLFEPIELRTRAAQ